MSNNRLIYTKTTQVMVSGHVGNATQYAIASCAHMTNPIMAFAPTDRDPSAQYKALTTEAELDAEIILLENNDTTKRKIKVRDLLV